MAVEIELKFEPAHHPKEHCVKDGEAHIRKTHILIEYLLNNLTLLGATWNCLKLSLAAQAVQDNGAGLMSHLMKNWSSDIKHIKHLQAEVRYQFISSVSKQSTK